MGGTVCRVRSAGNEHKCLFTTYICEPVISTAQKQETRHHLLLSKKKKKIGGDTPLHILGDGIPNFLHSVAHWNILILQVK